MGDAKRRNQAAMSGLDSLLDLVAVSMAKLAMACSDHLGADCFSHAQLTQAVLMKRGVASRIAIGFAGWRIGPSPTDLITHAPTEGLILPHGGSDGAMGFPYHVWLEVAKSGLAPGEIEPYILDFTTYQLGDKAGALDAYDGGSTEVAWCPPYLFRPKSQCVALAVLDADVGLGAAYYEERSDVTALIMAGAPPLDQEDLAALEMIMSLPEASILGPRSGYERMRGG